MAGKDGETPVYRMLTEAEKERLLSETNAVLDAWPTLGRRGRCIAFIDVEASALENGYPIEVGWAIYDPDDGNITTASDLILHSPWLDELAWDLAAEAVHHIPQEELHSKGKPVDVVAARMNKSLPRLVYTDCVEFDEAWIDQIFAATSIRRSFQILDVGVPFSKPPVTGIGYAHAEQHANRLAPRTHRAADDALYWAVMFQLASS